MSTCLLSLFLEPCREATDPGIELHVLITSNQLGGDERGDVMLVFVFVLVSVFFMTLLSEPTTDLAVGFAELMADGATMPELPEGLLQLQVSMSFLFVKPYAGFSQFQERVTEFIEIDLRFDGALLSEIFNPVERR